MPGSMARNSRVNVLNAISAIAPAVSTPVGPPPTTTKVRFAGAVGRVVGALGPFEGEQHPPTDLECVLDRLQAGRVRLPFVVTEVRVGRARWPRRGSRYDTSPSVVQGRPAGHRGRRRPPRRAARATFGLVGRGSTGSGGRCSRDSDPPSPPGRAAAGTGDGSGDRSPSPRTSASASPCAAARPPKPPPTIDHVRRRHAGNDCTVRRPVVRTSG